MVHTTYSYILKMAHHNDNPITGKSIAAAATFKDKGNDAFVKKLFTEAAAMYSKAIECTPDDHVLFSNRCVRGHYGNSLVAVWLCSP